MTTESKALLCLGRDIIKARTLRRLNKHFLLVAGAFCRFMTLISQAGVLVAQFSCQLKPSSVSEINGNLVLYAYEFTYCIFSRIIVGESHYLPRENRRKSLELHQICFKEMQLNQIHLQFREHKRSVTARKKDNLQL